MSARTISRVLSSLGPRSGAGAILLAIAAIVFLIIDERDRSGSSAGPGAPEEGREAGTRVEADVIRIVDGDTIKVELDGRDEDVRYIGIDTPESVKPDSPVECLGPEAAERNEELVAGETVVLEFDRELRDRFGRVLAYVYVDDLFVNAELVATGLAETLEIEPNTSQAGLLGRLESEASAAGRGIWGSC